MTFLSISGRKDFTAQLPVELKSRGMNIGLTEISFYHDFNGVAANSSTRETRSISGRRVLAAELPVLLESHGKRNELTDIASPHDFNKFKADSATRRTRFLFLYCNIVRPFPVGDTVSPLLRIVQVEADENERQIVIYRKPFYHPVNVDSFHAVKISIRDEYGRLVDCRADLTLHLRYDITHADPNRI